MKILAALAAALLFLGEVTLAASPPDELFSKISDAIRKHCPDAKIERAAGGFSARHGTMLYTLHSVSMTGEVSEKTYQAEGPNYQGFLLTVSLNDGTYRGQAEVPQTLREPYFSTFIDAVPTEDGQKYYQIRLSYGSRLDPELKKAIFEALPARAVPHIQLMLTPVLGRLFPQQRQDVERGAREGRMQALQPALDLVDRTHDRLVSPPDGSDPRENAVAFQEAWLLAGHLACDGGDPEAKRLLQAKWDALLPDKRTVTWQLGSLSSLCAPSLTDVFWDSTRDVKDPRTLEAYAYAICDYGNADDVKRADRWLSALPDAHQRQILANAISHLRYRLAGRPWPGPAQEPPLPPRP